MILTYTPTLADYRASLRLHYRRKITRRITHLAGLWLMPLVVFLLLTSSIYSIARTGQENSSGEIVWMMLALLFSLAIPISLYYRVSKQFKDMFPPSQLNREVTVDIDEDRVMSSLPGSSEGKYFWSSILDFAQDEKATLFYVRKNIFLFVPTQVMSPTQRDELIQIVARKMRKSV